MNIEKLAKIALLSAMGVVLFGNGAAQAAVCNVPADHATIGAAIAVPGCTTINVASGTYNEQVQINRNHPNTDFARRPGGDRCEDTRRS